MMGSILFDQPYFQTVVKALCWTLIHSLWQGLLLSILTGLLLLLSRKAAPTTRYNLFSGLFVLFILANAVTFYWVLEQGATSGLPVNFSSDGIAVQQIVHGSNGIARAGFGFVEIITGILNRNATSIVMVWLVVFLIKSARTAAGALYQNRLRRVQTNPVSESWEWELRQLAARLKIYSRVVLMESGIVKMPVTFGFWKPVILVPLGFLMNLPQQQIEAILLHELAHIKRRDYLVNILQCFAENVYFFNPALLWLSALIREEREHCCDDLVIGVTSDQMSFVNALVSFKEIEITGHSAGMLFAGNGNHLLNRIKRIIFNDNKQLTTMEKFSISTASLVAVAMLSMAYFSPLKQRERTLMRVAPKVTMSVAAEKAPVVKEDRIVKAKPVKASSTHIAAAPVDSLAGIDELMSDLKRAMDSKDLEMAKTVKGRLLTLIWEERQQVKAQTIETKLRSGAFAIQKGQTAAGDALGNLQEAMLKLEAEKLEARSAHINAIYKEFEKIGNEFWKEQREADAAEDEVLQEELIQDLISENVIKDRVNLSFKLHNMFLIVNGVEQPESLHQKLKAKYLKRTWTEWVYNWDGATGHRFTGVRYNG